MAKLNMHNEGPRVQMPASDTFAQSGVYFLFSQDIVVYVGKATNMRARIGQHLLDGCKVFDAVGCHPCNAKQMTDLEGRYIRLLLPKYNRCAVAATERAIRTLAGVSLDRPLRRSRCHPRRRAA